MRVLAVALLRRGQPDQPEQLDRALAGRRPADPARCARIASAICGPTRIVGFSDRAGSWKIIATSWPRCLRSSLGPSPISSVPLSTADPDTWALRGSSPMIARELAVLPDPDSPMIATVRPAGTV